MTTQTLIFKSTYLAGSRITEFLAACLKRVERRLPRRCMLISVGMLLAGLSVPFLMGLTLIPSSLFLGFLGMAFASIGCVLTLYYL